MNRRALTRPDGAQLGLFSSTQTDTSREAAVDNYPRSGTQRARVLIALYGARHAGGLTDEELSAHTGLGPSSERPRRVECVDAGWCEDTGERRRTRTGSRAAVWNLTDAGRVAARALGALA